MALELLILTPDQQTKRVALEGKNVSLGRAHGNDLAYPEDASLSRRHVRFRQDGRGLAEELFGRGVVAALAFADFDERIAGQVGNLPVVQLHRSGSLHGSHQIVTDARHREHFFFGNA